MGLFTRKQKRLGRYIEQMVSLWQSGGGLSGSGNQKKMIEAYRGWVYACAKKNSEAVASAELLLYHKKQEGSKPKYYLKTGRGKIKVTETTYEAVQRNPRLIRSVRKGIEIEEVSQHPLIDLMDQVNPFRNEFDLKFETVLFEELTGNAYWYLVPSGLSSPTTPGRKLPAEIWTLQSDKVTILPSEREFIKGYEYRVGEKRTIFEPSEIIHFRYANPENQFYGMSPLTAAAYAVDIDTSKKKYVFNFFKNYAIPPVIFKAAYDEKTGKGPKWNKEQWDEYKNSFMRMHAGPDNAGKMALLQGGLDIQNVGFSPKEFFHLVNNRPTIEEIAAIYGVPLFKLTGEGTDRMNAEKADYSYMKDTITPKLMQIAQKLNEQLIPLYDKNLFVEFENVIPEDKEFDLEEHKSLINIAMTVNEVRSARGLEPVENGDGLYMPYSNIPLGTERTLDPPLSEDDEDIPAEVIEDIASYLHKTITGKRLPIPPDSYQQRIARKYEGKVAAIIDGIMREMEAAMVTKIKSGVTDPEEVLRVAEEYQEKARKKADILDAPFIEAAEEGMAEVRGLARKRGKVLMESSFDIYSAEAIETLTQLHSNFSVAFTQTGGNIQSLRETLQDGYALGDSMEHLADRVSVTMGLTSQDTSWKALQIARTETIRASNYGAVSGWNQTGLVEGKEWDAAWDACDICTSLHGETAKLKESFDGGYFAPPDPHPSCRCTLLPLIFHENQ